MITKLLDVDKIKALISCSPHYDEIINSNIEYESILSYDLIDWYKEFLFSSNPNNKEDLKLIKLIDDSMYLYINNYDYRVGISSIINSKYLDLNSTKNTKKIIRKILNYTDKYQDEQIFNIKRGRWI